jgi:hypothetical protein
MRNNRRAAEYLTNPHVVVSDGEAIILDSGTNRFYGLNEAATFILMRLQAGQPLTDIENEYSGRYGVERSVAHSDVLAFTQMLAEKGISLETILCKASQRP